MSNIKNQIIGYLIVRLVGLAALSTIFGSSVFAQSSPPPQGAPWPPVFMTVTDTVAQINYNREYQPESVRLSAGQVVDFPPHLNCALAAGAIKVGDNVTVTGDTRTSPFGTTSIRAEAVTNNTSGQALSVRPAEPIAANISGSISQLNYGRGGELNGVILNTGELVLFPPPVSTSLNLAVGGNVTASGYERAVTGGRKVLDAQSVNNVAIGAPPGRQ
ncbi:MAG: hypothetical protein J2P31_11130 [Blastocatellia bacterium]|nr:hypothetical protein [Blastocatellia bacterium]